ncbi:MAG: 1,4-alpha-glucan branching protein GlgB [Erysipelotrichaceae bacterium]
MEYNDLLQYFFEGSCINIYDYFGAHINTDGSCTIRVFAPNAKNVQIIGSFNNWNGEWMTRLDNGSYEFTSSNIKEYDLYKFLIEDYRGVWREKSDPVAFYSEQRPKTSSIVFNVDNYQWNDEKWMKNRKKGYDQPLNIYEVHIGSWKKHHKVKWYSYQDLSSDLLLYVKANGYTHIELMPINEYPFDGSWGYQASGYFSPTSRYGDPNGLKKFIDQAHAMGIGVILDFVCVHFVKDAHGLVRFDGSPLYEYGNDRDGISQWDTYNFDLGKETTRSFLISSAAFFLDKYHFDGLRFDAISNLIFWGGNKSRGVNKEGLNFIKRCNYLLDKNFPNCILIAEDSSDFAKVTHPTYFEGLGFDYKWDLGWMNDTLKYYSIDPIFRSYEHNKLTFSMAYYYSEKFLLPLSHDEVVHGKGTIVNKMWGSYEQKLAQARNLSVYMMTHPGKKLNFMGNELGVFREWTEKEELDWQLLAFPVHEAFFRLSRDLNLIYTNHKELWANDYNNNGFSWIDADNRDQSIYSYYRESGDGVMVVVLNMLPTSYEHYEIGVPCEGEYIEIMNSEKDIYGGCNMCNYEPISSYKKEIHKQENAICIRIAPFSAIVFHVNKINK